MRFRDASSGQYNLVRQVVTRAFERAAVFFGGFRELALAPVARRTRATQVVDQGCCFVWLTATLEYASQAPEDTHVVVVCFIATVVPRVYRLRRCARHFLVCGGMLGRIRSD